VGRGKTLPAEENKLGNGNATGSIRTRDRARRPWAGNMTVGNRKAQTQRKKRQNKNRSPVKYRTNEIQSPAAKGKKRRFPGLTRESKGPGDTRKKKKKKIRKQLSDKTRAYRVETIRGKIENINLKKPNLLKT